jgi:DNA-binding transcriptional ArsR family regulator
MSFRPGLANIASVIADPAREAILVALADGRALPAGELAELAGVSLQSASRHLQKMVEAELLEVWTQGRFRYYRLASEEIAALLENMLAIANRIGSKSVRSARAGRVPPSLCGARRCYKHLAGRAGVELAQAFMRLGYVSAAAVPQEQRITVSGLRWLAQIGVRLPPQATFRLCMDGTERRPHFAGPAAAAILKHLEAHKFLVPDKSERRALRITDAGNAWFAKLGIGAGVDLLAS